MSEAYDRFITTVQQMAATPSWHAAERAAQGVLATVAERISRGEIARLARRDPLRQRGQDRLRGALGGIP